MVIIRSYSARGLKSIHLKVFQLLSKLFFFFEINSHNVALTSLELSV